MTITPQEAAETLEHMAGQLEIMITHFETSVSKGKPANDDAARDWQTQYDARLSDMRKQLQAMRMGKSGLTYLEHVSQEFTDFESYASKQQ